MLSVARGKKKITSIYFGFTFGKHPDIFQHLLAMKKTTSPEALKKKASQQHAGTPTCTNTHIFVSSKTSELRINSIQEQALGDSFILETTAA